MFKHFLWLQISVLVWNISGPYSLSSGQINLKNHEFYVIVIAAFVYRFLFSTVLKMATPGVNSHTAL